MCEPKLIALRNTDGEVLNVLRYSNRHCERVIILIHGACMNFSVGICRFIPELSNLSDEYDFISVNTRAHDLGYIENRFNKYRGWAWQKILENISDVDTVLQYVLNEGYKDIILCGHSWGALVCLDLLRASMNCAHTISNLVLFSPTVSYHLLLEVNYRNNLIQTLDKANELSWNGQLDEIISTPANSAIPFMSVKTVIDFNKSDFDFRSALRNCKVPINFIVGGLEHKMLIETCMNSTTLNNNAQCSIIKRANHFYAGREKQVVEKFDDIIVSRR